MFNVTKLRLTVTLLENVNKVATFAVGLDDHVNGP